MKLFSLSKKITFVLAALILGSSIGVAVAYASDENQTPENKMEAWIAQQEEAKNIESGYAEAEEDSLSFYELSYERATDEQQAQLEAIFADHSLGSVGEWRRDVLIVLGDLPADVPRLTAHDATNLYGKIEYTDLEEEFNKIAGAPDWVGGSGIERSVYFLNDERTEAIYLMLNDVYHIVFNEDGTQTRLPVGDQELPKPCPSVEPTEPSPEPPVPEPTEVPNTDNA